MKVLLVFVAALATTLSTAAAQGTPASANTAAKSSANGGSQPAGKGTGKVVVSPGGQGHNSGADPKGKILVAPTTSTSKGKRTNQINSTSTGAH